MTVRWKPLMFLSGVFLIVGLIGVAAIIRTLVSQSSQGILRVRCAARESGDSKTRKLISSRRFRSRPRTRRFTRIRGPDRDWAQMPPAEKRPSLRNERIDAPRSAVKFDKTIKPPRLALLDDSIHEDDVPDSIYWAKEVLNVDPNNVDAHYALAVEALDNRTPNVPEARRHLEVLEKNKASAIRVASGPGDARRCNRRSSGPTSVCPGRTITLGPDSDPVDRVAGLRMRHLDVQFEADPARLDEQVNGMLKQVEGMGLVEKLATARVARLRTLLEQLRGP